MNDLLQRITQNPLICHGKPCIRGLRYSVEWLLELLSSGMSNDDILADYEDLQVEDIQAVLLYAARLSLANQECFANALLSPPPLMPALERTVAHRQKLLRVEGLTLIIGVNSAKD